MMYIESYLLLTVTMKIHILIKDKNLLRVCVISMFGQSGQKAPKVPSMKSFTLEKIRVSKVSCIKRYAYQKFRV